jgi:group I intron endonuclease|tara:strand:- start:28 stop:726 length:699 start_codon:yes stop_codon:yes gene_type:complete
VIGIYKIENPKGKVYIGQSVDIDSRWKKYRALNCGNQTKIWNSLNKYGLDSHTFSVVEECKEDDLNKRERYWQDYYNVISEGLNCRLTETTDKSGRLSEETKILIGNSLRGKTLSEEARENMRKPKSDSSRIGRYDKSGKNNPFYGRTHSEETKAKIREKRKNQIITKETNETISNKLKKPILQFTKDGEFIKEFLSRNEAANELGINPSSISNNISGRKKTAGGFIWKYKY